MKIILSVPELGTIAWKLPIQITERIQKTSAIHANLGQKAYAEKVENMLKRDLTVGLTALSGAYTCALLTEQPGKLMEHIDARMKSLLAEIGAMALKK